MRPILPEFIRKNLLLKLLSLIIGASLWYFVVAEDQIDITISVPIEVHNLPQQLVIANLYTKSIEASIRGPRRIIKEVQNRNISRPIDLSSAKAGTVVINNDKSSIPFPQGITVQRLKPTNITLLVDQLVQKTLNITPNILGTPGAGYKMVSVSLNPNLLTVTGPKSILNDRLELQTCDINIDRLDQSSELQVQLDLDEKMLNLIGETIISVHIELEETMLTKTVHGIPVNVRDSIQPYKTVPTMITAQAEIPENLIRDTPELAMLFRAFVVPPGEQKPVEGKQEIKNNKDKDNETEKATKTSQKSEKSKKDLIVEVVVNGITIPGHREITVTSVTPQKVKLIPVKDKE